MLLYYDHYGRDTRKGFCFFGDRWPREIDPDINNRKGAGFLWNIFTNIYGDSYRPGTPKSLFCLRNCFGVGATVYGIAEMKCDVQGRYGTSVDFAVALPQDEQEKQLELDPGPLIQELRNSHEYGSSREYQGTTMPTCKISRNVPWNFIQLGAQIGWSKEKLLLLSVHPEKEAVIYGQTLYKILPAQRRKNFSFLSYAVNWEILYQAGGIDLIGVQDTQEILRSLDAMDRMGDKVNYLQTGSNRMNLVLNEQEPGAAYLRRIYPLLLMDGQLDLPVQAAEWLRNSQFGAACAGLSENGMQALGFALQAAASHKEKYYPLEEEKRTVSAAVFH